MSVSIVLLILALVCFVLACFPIPTRINLVALGLAIWVLSLLVGGAAIGSGMHLHTR